MNFKMKPVYVWVLSFIGGLLAFIFVYWLLNSPMPAPAGVEGDKNMLMSLIGWGLSRQTTHAALELSALVGLFSLLRLRSNILTKWETRAFFSALLLFFSYEYFKLIRSFQLVNQWERLLSSNVNVEHLFVTDPLQNWFFNANNNPVQAILVSVAVFLLIRIYAYACVQTEFR